MVQKRKRCPQIVYLTAADPPFPPRDETGGRSLTSTPIGERAREGQNTPSAPKIEADDAVTGTGSSEGALHGGLPTISSGGCDAHLRRWSRRWVLFCFYNT